MKEERFCETCRYWQDWDGYFGRCKRHAPRPLAHKASADVDEPPDQGEYYVSWPLVCMDSWCGEWASGEGAG